MFIGIGIGIPFSRVLGGGIGTTIAQNHHARVIADGGVMPVTAAELASLLNPICTAYNITTTAQFNTQFPSFSDPHWTGYGAGAGAGVTLGRAVRTVYSINPAADAVQTTAASQPLLLDWSGENYWFSVQEANNYVFSATTYATSDFDIEFRLKNTVSSQQQRVLNGNAAGNPWSIIFNVNTGVIMIEYYTSGFRSASCSTSLTGTNTFRISRNSTSGVITILKNGISQVVTGQQVAGALTSFPTELRIGNISTLAQGYQGYIYWVKFYIGGSVVRDFNPQQYNAATSQTQWTAATGEVWTINTGTATTGYKGVLVNRTIMQGDGVTSRLTTGVLPTRQYFTRYTSLNPLNVLAGAQYVISGNPTESHMLYKAGPTFAFYNTPSQINISPTAQQRMQIITGDYNGASSKVRVNQNADATGTTGAATSTIINLFSSSSGTFFANAIINTLVDSSTIDSDANKTVMFNTLRTMNRI